jgi:hypothetical protein
MSVSVNKADMLRLVLGLMSRPESLAFRDPVDWKGLGLDDYPAIVKTPMDLGTIKKGIEANTYSDVDDIVNDIRLVWTNCMLYNRDGSEFYHLADTFAKCFEDAYGSLRKIENSKANIDRIPSVDEKLQMTYDIFKIENAEMAKVLTMIESSCPSALSRKSSLDEVLINFDALPPRLFHEVNLYISNCIYESNTSTKASKKKTAAASSKKSK